VKKSNTVPVDGVFVLEELEELEEFKTREATPEQIERGRKLCDAWESACSTLREAIASFCDARGARYHDVQTRISSAIPLIIRILSGPRAHRRQRPLSIHPAFVAILAASIEQLGLRLKWSRPKNKTGEPYGPDLDLFVTALRLARAQLLPIKERPYGLPANPRPETIVRTLRLLRRKDVVDEAAREFIDLSDPSSIANSPHTLLLIVGRHKPFAGPD
jgi:hypothetical protein